MCRKQFYKHLEKNIPNQQHIITQTNIYISWLGVYYFTLLNVTCYSYLSCFFTLQTREINECERVSSFNLSSCLRVRKRQKRQRRLTFLWRSDCDGLGCELLIKVSGVRLRRHLGLEGRDKLSKRDVKRREDYNLYDNT